MPPPPDYSHHNYLGVDVITPEIESLLGILEVNRVGGELMAMVEAGTRKLVLDLKNVKFIGSAALGMLLGLASELKSKGGRLVLANAQNIEPLLKITRARDKFQLAPDLIKAMEMFRE